MRAKREGIAKYYWAEGEERAREIRAGADREREVILATAYETSRKLSGEGDAQAAAIYAQAFGQDPEFYAFTRRLQTYGKILSTGTTPVLPPDSELLRYLQNPGGNSHGRAPPSSVARPCYLADHLRRAASLPTPFLFPSGQRRGKGAGGRAPGSGPPMRPLRA